jgi:hypothetical protein
MNLEYSVKSKLFFAQAYGGDSYGAQIYSGCQQTPEECTPITNETTTPIGTPNTGFFGMSPDAAIASSSGALLIVVAIAGVVYVLFSRRRALKSKARG